MRILINIIALLCISFSAFSIDCSNNTCIAVVDAGSSGSRLHVYSAHYEANHLPTFREEWSKKINPGISSVLFEQESVNIYLNQLFKDAPILESVPLYFYATAGMRLQSQPRQEQLYSLISNWFQQQTSWQLIEAKTITGQDEGLYGWLAVNYQLNTLSGEKPPVGVLDMGGASVQIAFPVKKKLTQESNFKSIDLYGHHYDLFIHSFLGLGQNELAHQFLTNPECFSNNYSTPEQTPGQGDAIQCSQSITHLINRVQHVKQLIYPNRLFKSNNQWFVLGGLAELAKSPIFSLNTEFSSEQLIDVADQRICKQEWAELSMQYPNDGYVYEDCLLASYYYSLITEGYGFRTNERLNYSSENNDWTIGVLLLKVSNSSNKV